MNRKLIALSLIVALLMPIIPAGAFSEAEEVHAEFAEPMVEEVEAILDDAEIDDASDVEGGSIELSEFVLDGFDSAEALNVEAIDPDSGDPAQGEPADEGGTPDSSGADSGGPSFVAGYVAVVADGCVMEAFEGEWPVSGTLPAGTVLYAFESAADGRLAVCFATATGAVRGWVVAESVRTMGDGEVEAFAADAASLEHTVYFDEAHLIPLAWLGDAPAAQTAPADDSDEANGGNVEDVDTAGDQTGNADVVGGLKDAEGTEAEVAYAIGLNKAALDLRVGETVALKVKMIAKGAGATAWSVEDESIAAVSEDGKVTGAAVGETRVFVTAENGDQGMCPVIVRPEPDAVHFKYSSLTLGVGEKSGKLKVVLDSDDVAYAGKVTFSSSNTRYVTVGADGVIKGVRTGSATITGKIYNGLKATCKVTVKKAPKKISASTKSITLGLGESRKLSYTLTSGSAGAVSWKSSKPNAVSVDSTGVITALDKKSATITLRTYNGKTATVSVYVRNAPESIALEKETITIGVGQTLAVKGTVNEGAAGKLVYTSRDPACASTSGSKITGVAEGETDVDVTTYVDTPPVACHVIVKPAPQWVKMPYSTLCVGVDNYYKLKPVIEDGTAAGFTFATSNSKYVAVSSDGVIKGKKTGSATITIKTHNGQKCKLKVVVRKKPGKITASPRKKNLGLGETFKLGYSLPSGTGATVAFTPVDEASAEVLDIVKSTGEITGLQLGEGKVRVTTYNGKKDTCVVQVMDAPEWIDAGLDEVTLGVEQTKKIVPAIPEGSASAFTYTTKDAAVAKVSSAGVITAVGEGTTKIRVATYLPEVFDEIDVTVKKAPSVVTLDETALQIDLGTAFTLVPHIPEGSATEFTFSSSDTKIATISSSGEVYGKARGTAKLTVKTHNGKKAALTLTVYDPLYPESIAVTERPSLMMKGDSYQILYEVLPDTAYESVKWTSSDVNVATVDETGLVQAVNLGYCTISAVSTKNSGIKKTFTLAVQTEAYTLVIPKRTTAIDGIEENLRKIRNIRDCAIACIDRLESRENGISASDADKRRSMVNNIFQSYAFPWMTLNKQNYWKAANSENGAKDFKPGKVYYGLPYISGSGSNRAYNVPKALSEGRYKASGNGYYLLNQGNYLNGKYVGCDCSGLCNTAIWGVQSSHTYDRTCDIAVSSAYKKGNFDYMFPGDLICKGYAHVVMFLYYASYDHSKIMIIENGGSEAGTNTVHCSVMNVSTYKNNGYKVRRLASLK